MAEQSCTIKIDDVFDVSYLLHVWGDVDSQDDPKFEFLSAWSNVCLAPGLEIRLELPRQTQGQIDRLESHLKAVHGDKIREKFLEKVSHRMAGEAKD